MAERGRGGGWDTGDNGVLKGIKMQKTKNTPPPVSISRDFNDFAKLRWL